MVGLEYEYSTVNAQHVMTSNRVFLGVIRRIGTSAKWYFKASEFHEFCYDELFSIAHKLTDMNEDHL